MTDIFKPMLAIFLLASLAFVLYRESNRADLIRRNRFIDRPSVSEREFLAECFSTGAQNAEFALSLRLKIADSLGIPAEKLAPSDRFDKELKSPRGWEHDDGVNVLLLDLQAAIDRKGLAIDIKKVQSVRDYVNTWAKV